MNPTRYLHRQEALEEACVGAGVFLEVPSKLLQKTVQMSCGLSQLIGPSGLSHLIPEILVVFDQPLLIYMRLAQKEEKGNRQSGLLKVLTTFVARVAVTS